MKAGRAPTYRLKESHVVTLGEGMYADRHTFAPGTFVRPVSFKNLPQHLKDQRDFKVMKESEEAACYTRLGFHVIPWAKIEVLE